MLVKSMLLVGVIFVSVSTQSLATVVIHSFTLEATDFLNDAPFGSPAPHPTVTGEFSFQFDNSASFGGTQFGGGTTEGLSISNFSFPAISAPNYSYYQPTDLLILGTNTWSTGCQLVYNGDDFCTWIDNISTSPTVRFFQYTSSQGSGLFQTSNVSLTISNPVPEPANWAMMIAGFGLAGASLRRRRLHLINYPR